MTVDTCIQMVDEMKPNGFPSSIKHRFLGEVEGKVRVELLGESPEALGFTGQASRGSTELAVPFPYDQLYLLYISAMMDHTSGDIARYENTASLFNAVYQSYGKWLKRRGA